jgi:hypothetical protein
MVRDASLTSVFSAQATNWTFQAKAFLDLG